MAVRRYALGVHPVLGGVGAHPAYGTLGVVELGRPGISTVALIEEAILDAEGDVARLGQFRRRRKDVGAATEDQSSTVEEEDGGTWRLALHRLHHVEQE